MLSKFITSMISVRRTKICDIDVFPIDGTSSLFNNVMQIVHEMMTLLVLPPHWENITLHLDLVYVIILPMVLVLKKAITDSTWIYKVIYICMLIDSLPRIRFHFIEGLCLRNRCRTWKWGVSRLASYSVGRVVMGSDVKCHN